jgi:lipopolysaccharide export system protein LptA
MKPDTSTFKKLLYSLLLCLNTLTTYKHIALSAVLCLYITGAQAQLQPRQLRKEILQSQAKLQPKTVKSKIKKTTPFNANPNPLATVVNPLAGAKSIVYMENAEQLSFDMMFKPDAQVLRHNVRFRQDNVLLYCDSAYFYQKANSLDAFGNVRIVQGDTLFVYSDVLYYDGNTKLARMRNNVRMVNRKTTLTTDSLNYDRMGNLAYYFTGGKIVDELNTLTSVWGQYSPATKEALFQKKVHLLNKNFTLDSDTLKYNTNTNVANIVGPTHILYNKETNIYSKSGWYNTATERMMLLHRSLVKQKDGKTMIGDTIFYDKKAKFGEGFSRVVLNDTVQKQTLIGYYVNYNEQKKCGLAADSAMLVDWSSKDTLYLHADTLRTKKDSIYDVARGHYGVRFFRDDIQGLCDSLVYSTRDSVLNLHGLPVVWTDKNQLSGEYIQAISKNKKLQRIEIQQSAMALQQQDSIHFNQLSGKEIIAYIDSSALKRVYVNGNAETIYYPVDDLDSTMIGLNRTQSSYVMLYLKDKKIDRIVFTTASTGNMYPLADVKEENMFMKNFFWLDEQRPKKREDIFKVFNQKKRPTYSDLLAKYPKPTSVLDEKKPKKALSKNDPN